MRVGSKGDGSMVLVCLGAGGENSRLKGLRGIGIGIGTRTDG